VDLGLQNKGCIVTGASQGIGRAIARRLADEGAHVLLLARSLDGLRESARRCGDNATVLALDVTGRDAPERIAETAAKHLPEVDVLINNAGISASRPLETLTADDFQAHLDIHLLAPLRLMQQFVPGMARRGHGTVVNVASIAGRRPTPTNAAYSVAKAAELNLTRAFADHYAAQGVRINAVNPGPVETPLWVAPGGLADQIAARQGVTAQDVLAGARAATPQGRFGTADEVAAVVVFLCSEQASNVAGAAWHTDGGAHPSI
jgi:NAD(P)-dependent dehydrogenase (short-subunit alcohol dehydrogenase family)